MSNDNKAMVFFVVVVASALALIAAAYGDRAVAAESAQVVRLAPGTRIVCVKHGCDAVFGCTNKAPKACVEWEIR